jgi:serine/threonine protein kinase/Tol biopolymer transport system component
MSGRAARTLRPQDEISHYRIVGPLGAGGMGEVYLAQDQSLERRVALKILPPDLVRSEERLRRFVLEAKSASSLSHPNIVTIYEIGQDAVRSPGEADSSPVHFISMELVSGRTLSTLIHEEKTDLRTLLGYLAQVAEGLAKAHAAGIVHRDLKPGNIMVTADGFAKVLDFGLAKLTERREPGPEASTAQTVGADATDEGVVLGTAGYMSPEQVQGKAVDHRSDIFSFGSILYEAATRRRPFAADTAVETMHRILHDTPLPVEELNASVPAELRRLIRRCLAKNPEQRLQSMKDVALELREMVEEYATLSASASSGSLGSGSSRTIPVRRASPWIWIALSLAALGSVAVVWWSIQHRPPQGQPYESMRMTAQTERGDVVACALSQDGRYLAYVRGLAGREELRVRQVATGSDVVVLPTTDTPLQFPSFSPDGNYLFYCASRPDAPNYRSLYQVPSLGGTPRERAFDVDSRISFSPDGRQFAFWRHLTDPRESRLVVRELESGKERMLVRIDAQSAFSGAPAWSPDGRRIAAVLETPAPDLESTIAMFDPATGRREDFLKLKRTFVEGIAWRRGGRELVCTGTDLKLSVDSQVFLYSYPDGRTGRVTNDFNFYTSISASPTDESVAVVREMGLGNLWLADASGAPASRLTSFTDPGASPNFAVAADSVTIVYCAPQDRFLQLWAMGMVPGPARQLTTGDAHSVVPHSAAGTLVFERLDGTGNHIWRMRPDGSDQMQLTRGGGERTLSLSSDGRMALASHFESMKRVSVVSTEDGRVLRSDSTANGTGGFSPDGRSVLLGRSVADARGLSTTVWDVLPVAGGPATATVRVPPGATQLRWAPDSRALTYRDRADPAWNVFRGPTDGGKPQAVTHFTDGRVTDYSWSPDGSKLAVRRLVGESSNLWVTAADGSRPVQLTQFTSEAIFGFGWAPDSRHVVVGAGTDATDAVLIRGVR